VTYRVQVSQPAKKELDRLDQVTARRLRDRLKELTLDPFSTRLSKAVIITEGQRTARVGNWRIIYRVDDEQKVTFVIAFRPRGKAYQDL
jgi:mRNA-degrading endonuclease RelE of RelBE toxin-antitoxin system